MAHNLHLAYLTIFLLVILEFSIAEEPRTNPLTPISEAQQLYCNHCRSSCQYDDDAYRPSDARTEGDVRLQCKCEAIYDLKSRSLICKNMSEAKAKFNNQETRAISRSHAKIE